MRMGALHGWIQRWCMIGRKLDCERDSRKGTQTMLHKGKLLAALNAKRGQFSLYDGSFSEQLKLYQYALETLCEHYPSSVQSENALPPDGIGRPPAGARPSSEFDRWLVDAPHREYHAPH